MLKLLWDGTGYFQVADANGELGGTWTEIGPGHVVIDWEGFPPAPDKDGWVPVVTLGRK